MNILFVLYGDLSTNTANPIALFSQYLNKLGHDCIICYPNALNVDLVSNDEHTYSTCSYRHVLDNAQTLFLNGRAADVLHACTPRESVRLFVIEYMQQLPTPLVIYLEDNERWIVQNYMSVNDTQLLELTNRELSENIPKGMSNPFLYKQFIGLADLVLLIQEKLNVEVPIWMPQYVLPWGVDLAFFSPREALDADKKKFHIEDDEKVVVYHGGLNGFTAPAIRDLCEAILLINKFGIKCKLIRTGIMPLYFLDELGPRSKDFIIDVGVVDRKQLPQILAIGDLYVQPGRINPFEDLRLPSKVPEFLAMGKPVLLPNVNIAHLFQNGSDAVILMDGGPEEIAEKCIDLFNDNEHTKLLGRNARKFAERYFDIKKQTLALEAAYRQACSSFNYQVTKQVWKKASNHGMDSAFALRNLLLNNFDSEFNQLRTTAVINLVSNLNDRINSMSGKIDALNILLRE